VSSWVKGILFPKAIQPSLGSDLTRQNITVLVEFLKQFDNL
jgi:hypothetical protein